jgi:glycerate 2-kinase
MGGDTAAMASIPSTILVAPDSFKGTLSAPEVARAVGRGLERGGWATHVCPLADGGEGTLKVLIGALGGELRITPASDPLGRPVEAAFGLVERPRRSVVAIVESAAATGLSLLEPGERDPLGASTAGTGELMLAARETGAEVIYLGVGGSATTDGGKGALEAIAQGGGLGATRLVVLCDVRTPFELAAQVYGPQKGAAPREVARLTQRLHALARGYARDPRGVPMTGAAGGLAGGLWAQLGAELVSGASFVLDLLEFDRRMLSSRAVVTGEGRLDEQSLAGKVVSEVATRARQAGVPCHAIVGQRALDAFGARILDLQAVLEAGTPRALSAAGRRLADLI